jgi:GAF domain-containing protein
MPTRQGKKSNKGDRNPNRRNGKAWKKHPETGKRVRTPERQEKDAQIVELRLRRKETNQARRAEEKRLAEELAEQVAAEVAQKVAQENSRIAAVQVLKKGRRRAHVVA